MLYVGSEYDETEKQKYYHERQQSGSSASSASDAGVLVRLPLLDLQTELPHTKELVEEVETTVCITLMSSPAYISAMK